jgi:aquaporin Z
MGRNMIHSDFKIRCLHYISEFAVTFIVFLLGFLGILLCFGFPSLFVGMSEEYRFIIAVSFFCFMIAVGIKSPFGKLSGAHMNPAISFAFWLEKQMSFMDFLFYVLMQVLAVFLAAKILFLIFPAAAATVGYIIPVAAKEGWVVTEIITETLGTSIVVALIMFLIHDKKLVKLLFVIVPAIFFVLILMTADSSGASLNPVRFLGPAFASGKISNYLIYSLSPMVGAALVVFINKIYNIYENPAFFRLNHEEGFIDKIVDKFKGR